jgi:hypothetical protein
MSKEIRFSNIAHICNKNQATLKGRSFPTTVNVPLLENMDKSISALLPLTRPSWFLKIQ